MKVAMGQFFSSFFVPSKRLPSLVNARHVHVLVFRAGGLASVSGAVLALEQRLAVLVHLDLGDLDLRGVDAHVHGVA